MVRNRDRPEIYENPLIEQLIMGLIGHLEKQTYKLYTYKATQTIITFSQVILIVMCDTPETPYLYRSAVSSRYDTVSRYIQVILSY